MSVVRKVFKYKLWDLPNHTPDEVILEMPTGAQILSIQPQDYNGIVAVWAFVHPEAPVEKRTLRIFGTGHPIPPLALAHVATFQLEDGQLVFHVFEEMLATPSIRA